MRSTAAFLTCLALLHCESLPSEPAQRTESLDAPFELGVGEEASIPDSLEVMFRDVLRDSRCPADVQCIRAGEAVLVFEVVAPGGDSESVRIDMPPSGEASNTIAGYTIHVEALEPAARSTGAIDKNAYRATLRITVAAEAGSVDARAAARVQ